MWHAEPFMWCLPSDPWTPIKWLMEFNKQYSVKVLYFVLRFFPFKSFMRRMIFMSLSAIFINLDKDNCYNVDRIFCTKMIMETDTFFISYKM